MKTLTSNLMKRCFIVLIAFFMIGCTKRKCDDTRGGDAYSIYGAGMVIDFKDTSGSYLLTNNSPYNESNVKVIDQDGDELYIFFQQNQSGKPPYVPFKSIYITGFINKSDITYQNKCKTMYIDFASDRDTLDYCFTTVKDECGPKLEGLNIKFNGKVVEGSYDENGFTGTVIK